MPIGVSSTTTKAVLPPSIVGKAGVKHAEEPHIEIKRSFVPVSIPDRSRMRFSVGTAGKLS
jgi:hypothetical protein